MSVYKKTPIRFAITQVSNEINGKRISLPGMFPAVATRRHQKCTYCGAELPHKLLFTPEEKKQVEEVNQKLYQELKETIKKNHELEMEFIRKSDYGSGGS